MKTTEYGEIPSRTILDCKNCGTVVTAPMEEDGVYLCPDCEEPVEEQDYVAAPDVFAVLRRVAG